MKSTHSPPTVVLKPEFGSGLFMAVPTGLSIYLYYQLRARNLPIVPLHMGVFVVILHLIFVAFVWRELIGMEAVELHGDAIWLRRFIFGMSIYTRAIAVREVKSVRVVTRKSIWRRRFPRCQLVIECHDFTELLRTDLGPTAQQQADAVIQLIAANRRR